MELRVMPNALAVTGWTAGTAQQRVDDLHAAFADPDVGAIVAAIGGNHSNELVDLLDYDLIRANPKIFQGLSDITVLHCAIQRHAGLATFYGPALITSLAEFPAVLELTDRSMRAAWFGDRAVTFEPAPEWTDEFLDFGTQADLTRRRHTKVGEGWVWLHQGRAEGPLLGGCLETLCWHVRGTAEWPDLSGAVLMLETSEEAPSPATVASYLTDLWRAGTFDQIAGLVVARPMNYRAEHVEVLWRVIADVGNRRGIPVLANVDCGHTDPMLTIPLGLDVVLDSAASRFATLRPLTQSSASTV
jgi:muramoyltetrapeptide carboxypeptidase LdcA involved in peptidoglycan recycling